MACGGCAKRRMANQEGRQRNEDSDLLAGYANLNDRQIKARLDVYKRRYCTNCDKRYDCDYSMYTECRKNAQIK